MTRLLPSLPAPCRRYVGIASEAALKADIARALAAVGKPKQ